MSDTDRDGFDNLILLCSPHHDEVDKDHQGIWTVERLAEIKARHELGWVGPAATKAEEESERVCCQLIEGDAIYQQGIMIGTIVAGTVNITHGNVSHIYASATSQVGGREADRKLLADTVANLGQAVKFIRAHDFHSSFDGPDVDPLYRYHCQCDGPEHEFLDRSVEDSRLSMRSKIASFCKELSARTFSQGGGLGEL